MLESLFATLASKLIAGGIAVAMAVTGLAGIGNLPDQAQTSVSEALDNVNIEVPLGESAQEALEAAEEAAAEALEKAEAAAELAEENADVEGDTGEPNENAAFGQSVAEDAKDGGVDGQVISARARAQAEERKAAGQANRPENAGPPADAGTQSQAGLDTASDTPARGNIPNSVRGGQGSAD